MADLPRTLVLFPGALGDFLCLLPALAVITEKDGRNLTLVAKPELLSLPAWPRAARVSIDRSELATLYSPEDVLADTGRERRHRLPAQTLALLGGHAVAHSWSGSGIDGFATRFGELAESSFVHRFRGMAPGEHAAAYFARCLGVTPASPAQVRSVLARDDRWLGELAPQLPSSSRWWVIHPGSGSPAKNWSGFLELLTRLSADRAGEQRWIGQEDRILVLLGPAEEERGTALPADTLVRSPSLPQLAALLERSDRYLGNDSGVSHLAGAIGSRGVALFADTAASCWAPRGDVRVLQAAAASCDCGVFCTHRLSVDTVLRALTERR